MWDFIKRLFKSIYRRTVGGLVRLVKHAAQGKVDGHDKVVVSRLLRQSAFFVVLFFFPALGGLLMALRIMALGDVFGIISDVYEDVVTAYLKQPAPAPA